MSRDDHECRSPRDHQLHVCQLKKQGLTEELAARTDSPAFTCHNCNALANRAEDLCNPSPLPVKA
jgi:hypothetical protein